MGQFGGGGGGGGELSCLGGGGGELSCLGGGGGGGGGEDHITSPGFLPCCDLEVVQFLMEIEV